MRLNFRLHFLLRGAKVYLLILYNDQRNAQVFNLFIYLLLPDMFRAFFKPVVKGRYTTSAVIQVSWYGFSAHQNK
jgi:hypothetical protein